ncbi:MAG: metal ABC transporter substrate-binding protein [Oscillospiraceae bacterium]|jgi:zinc transport system substrate-binding protein|nr:metal ABC transporter substrate-binding protein [Oscillospiraceae bacterium]
MKTKIGCILIAALLVTGLSGCAEPIGGDSGKVRVVCTIFPQYDWVRALLGNRTDDFDLTLLLASGIDLHSYQPSIEDIAKITESDLFIYVGGESDMWVDGVLENAENPNMRVLNLLEAAGDTAKAEEIVEGMQDDEHDHGEEGHEEEEHDGEEEHGEEEHSGEEEHGEEEHGEEEAALDEHVWLSLRNAQTLCGVIADTLAEMDPAHAEDYAANLTAYTEKLRAMDGAYQAAVDAANVNTLLFCDRFPFRYLVDDYGLLYHAAFPGCSAETEASFETLAFLTEKTDELNLKNVMVTESSDRAIANTVIRNTAAKDQQILVLNAMQSVTSDDIADGVTYLSLMEDNLAVLKDALGD